MQLLEFYEGTHEQPDLLWDKGTRSDLSVFLADQAEHITSLLLQEAFQGNSRGKTASNGRLNTFWSLEQLDSVP